MIDAPTLLHIVAEGVEVSRAHQLVAPNLIRSQALALLLAAVRDGEITEEVALQRHERLTELKMRLLGDRVSRRTAWKIAGEHGWASTFEAEYVAVTKLQADALVTIDPALSTKAGPIVPVASVAALTARLTPRLARQAGSRRGGTLSGAVTEPAQSRKHPGNTATLRSRRAPHAPCGEGQKENIWIQATRRGCWHRRHSCCS